MCQIAKIDAFVSEWPDSGSGPAHIVISDANLRDGDIDWCLSLFDSLIEGTPWPEDETKLPRSLYAKCSHEELRATRDFLRTLRALPESERVQPGDRLCRDV